MKSVLKNERPFNPINFKETKRPFFRQRIGEILQKYNQDIGNDAIAAEQVNRFIQGTSCVVTGQQLGLLGGPSYTILKAISAILLAREINAVPIFWLATEDHDVAEIDHTYWLDAQGNLDKFHLPLPRSGVAVEDLTLSPKSTETLLDLFTKVNDTSAITAGSGYAHVMAQFLAKIFAGTGLVFLEPRLFREMAIPFFMNELRYADEIANILQEKDTNLFMKDFDGRRLKIKRSDDAFIVGEKSYTLEQLLELVEEQPDRFSPNVYGRPLLQSLLLPTLAYVAGPNEMRYLEQLKEYHAFYQIEMPTLVPRLSATFIPHFAADFLEKCSLKPWETIPERWEREPPQGVPPHALHLLRNLLKPHHELQERTLNWCYFQAQTKENLIQACLQQLDWKPQGHYYCETE